MMNHVSVGPLLEKALVGVWLFSRGGTMRHQQLVVAGCSL
jgi:hypothetical protein